MISGSLNLFLNLEYNRRNSVSGQKLEPIERKEGENPPRELGRKKCAVGALGDAPPFPFVNITLLSI